MNIGSYSNHSPRFTPVRSKMRAILFLLFLSSLEVMTSKFLPTGTNGFLNTKQLPSVPFQFNLREPILYHFVCFFQFNLNKDFSGGNGRETYSPKGHKVGFPKQRFSKKKLCFGIEEKRNAKFSILISISPNLLRNSHRERCRKFVFAPDCRSVVYLFYLN